MVVWSVAAARSPDAPLPTARPSASVQQPTPERQAQPLARLPEEVWPSWQTPMEPMDLPLGKVLCEAGVVRRCAGAWMDEFQQSAPAMHLILRCAQALLTQVSQTSVCRLPAEIAN